MFTRDELATIQQALFVAESYYKSKNSHIEGMWELTEEQKEKRLAEITPLMDRFLAIAANYKQLEGIK